ncbi:hypothetical protein [Aurantibacillus circumpalustris]|uniref:hypothetical protein n=1 Tax=Aurantibacillus circumpalustris TaxID=3036359 RepID=UPI00295A7F2F|nr:hypothetical protein [Aurantibacillus circumpalustris]
MIRGFMKKYKKQLIGIFLGGVVGYLYYFFIGCSNGTCIISSNPLVSVPYGSLLGFLLVGTFKKKENVAT